MRYPSFDGTQACANLDTELFFSPNTDEFEETKPKPADYRQAKAICKTCEWQTPCLSWALSEPMVMGVWGGTSERERSRMRGKLRVA